MQEVYTNKRYRTIHIILDIGGEEMSKGSFIATTPPMTVLRIIPVPLTGKILQYHHMSDLVLGIEK